VRTYELPQISIAKGVQLSWPSPAGVNWTILGAPTVEGPWLPVQDVRISGMQQLTVPAGGLAQFFRPVPAP
jgi:hypothetical protein